MQEISVTAPNMAGAQPIATNKYWQQAQEFSGDTFLHQLVLQDSLKKIPAVLVQEQKLMETVRKAINDADLEMLGATNKRGDTPLHLAVARGGLEGNEICAYLCERERELSTNMPATINIDPSATVQLPSTKANNLGETPIFLAALHGNLKAFVLLHARHPIEKESRSYYTRKHDGNTILHVAVLGQHFDLAYNIISKYPFLVNCKNDKKETPLHLLAKSPTTFRSGYHLEPMDNLLFYLLRVPPMEKVDLEKDFDLIKSELTTPANKNAGFFTKCHELWSQFRKCRAKTNIMASDKSASGPVVRPWLYPILNEMVFCLGFIIEILLCLFGFRFSEMEDLKGKRRRDNWGTRVAAELVKSSTEWNIFELNRDEKYASPQPQNISNYTQSPDHDIVAVDVTGGREIPSHPDREDKATAHPPKCCLKCCLADATKEKIIYEEESSIFVAAKHGVVEIVEEILKKIPFAIHYEDKENKNIVLLSVENRQYQLFEYLIKSYRSKNAFQRVDKNGNSVSHLAAKLVEMSSFNFLANILGATLQVQWDIKWFKYIRDTVEGQALYNNDGKSAQTLFDENHKQLVEDAGKWLTASATACSVVAGLVATVAFATSTSFPGGTEKGLPVLEGKTFFNVFVVASFFGLCFAIISVLSFLAILNSRLLLKDFEKHLPTKLIVGLVSLFLSVVFMLVCYCSGHFSMLKSLCSHSYFIRKLVRIMTPFGFYALISYPVVAMFIGPHFALLMDLLLTTFGGRPWQRFARGFF